MASLCFGVGRRHAMTRITLDVHRLARNVGMEFVDETSARAFCAELTEAFRVHQHSGWPYQTAQQLRQLAITLILQYANLDQLRPIETADFNLSRLRDVHEYVDVVD